MTDAGKVSSQAEMQVRRHLASGQAGPHPAAHPQQHAFCSRAHAAHPSEQGNLQARPASRQECMTKCTQQAGRGSTHKHSMYSMLVHLQHLTGQQPLGAPASFSINFEVLLVLLMAQPFCQAPAARHALHQAPHGFPSTHPPVRFLRCCRVLLSCCTRPA
jgi:hypothetical protein